MKTHPVWMLALTNVVALSFSHALAQNPFVAQPYAAVSGSPAVAQASYDAGACGACGGGGCGICGQAPSAGGFYLSDAIAAHRAAKCDSGSCDGCADCGAATGLHSGLLGGGHLDGAGHLLGGLQHLQPHHYGGYSTQHLGKKHGPFGDGGCCTPMWYDVHVEWMYLSREDVGESIDFTSQNINGPRVLSTDDLTFDEASGFRATYALLVGPSTNIEATYFGTNYWSDAASVTGDGNLHSVFSNYGQEPVDTSQDPPVLGFPQTVDFANFHGIEYSSELHNGEINLRHRWVSANCLLHGSYLMGARYVSLSEEFNHRTRVPDGGFLDYTVDTQNDAVGFQIGTDLYVCVSPRFKLGAEVEAGVLGNRTTADTVVNTREVDGANVTDNSPLLTESEDDTDAAFVGEIGAIGLFKVTPRFTIRGGYQLMYVNGVALASENFNTQSPFAPRQAFVDHNGDVFYHGATLGFEWLW